MHQYERAREQRRGALHGDRRVGREVRAQHAVEARRVELAEGEVVRVGEVDDRRVEEVVAARRARSSRPR